MPPLALGILIGVVATCAVFGCAIAYVRHKVTPRMENDLMAMAEQITSQLGSDIDHPGGPPSLTDLFKALGPPRG